MKSIQIIWQDVIKGKNIDVYITIFLSIIVAILGIFGKIDESVITSVILVSLALVLNSLLKNQRENDKIKKGLSQIEKGTGLSSKFFQNNFHDSQFIEPVQQSRKAFFLGAGLTVLIPALKDQFQYGLEHGLEARFIIIQPYGQAINAAALRSYRKHDLDYFSTGLERSLTHLDDLSQNIGVGKLEYKVIDFLPPFNIAVFDPHLPSSLMFIMLNTFRAAIPSRPYFILEKNEDSLWFDFFYSQFESMWKAATPFQKSPDKI